MWSLFDHKNWQSQRSLKGLRKVLLKSSQGLQSQKKTDRKQSFERAQKTGNDWFGRSEVSMVSLRSRSGLIVIADWFPTLWRRVLSRKGRGLLATQWRPICHRSAMRQWLIGTSSTTSRRSVAKCADHSTMGLRYVTDLSTHYSIILSQVHIHRVHINYSIFYCLIIITIVSRTGKKTREKMHNQQKIQLQHFDLFFAVAATATALLLISWQFVKKWFNSKRYPFIWMFQPVIDWQLVTDQSRYSCNQSPNSCPLVTDRSQQITSLSLYLRLTVADKLPINHWQVTKPIADWSAIIPLFQIWTWSGYKVSAISNQLQWNQSQKGCIPATLSVWLML